MIIRLAFQKKTKSFNLMAWLIKIWTRSPYFHVELVIEDKWVTSNSDVGGVVVRDLKPFKDSWDYVNVDVNETQLLNVWYFIWQENGSAYDWCGIFCAQVLGLNHHNPREWFCSEFVSEVLKQFKHPEFIDVNPIVMNPGDIYKLVTKHNRMKKI